MLACIKKLGCFNLAAARFYIAEIVAVIEYMHTKQIIHRDLKPENILLGDDGHIKVTDFGTAKILGETGKHDPSASAKANSFVGTAEYVSPELLTDKAASQSSDLWAIGCLVFQLLAGKPPFKGSNEYQTFQKIIKLEYKIPEGFPETAKDLVQKLLVADPPARLGAGPEGFAGLKAHPFFDGINWENLATQQPPKLVPYLPLTTNPESGELESSEQYHVDGMLEAEISQQFDLSVGLTTAANARTSDPERMAKVEELKKSSEWGPFLLDELIIHSGIVYKRKGLFSKRRQLILTDMPRLIYIDPEKMEQKGEIPFERLHSELKTKRHFFVHTPGRIYYLEDPSGNAAKWVKALEDQVKVRAEAQQ